MNYLTIPHEKPFVGIVLGSWRVLLVDHFAYDVRLNGEREDVKCIPWKVGNLRQGNLARFWRMAVLVYIRYNSFADLAVLIARVGAAGLQRKLPGANYRQN